MIRAPNAEGSAAIPYSIQKPGIPGHIGETGQQVQVHLPPQIRAQEVIKRVDTCVAGQPRAVDNPRDRHPIGRPRVRRS